MNEGKWNKMLRHLIGCKNRSLRSSFAVKNVVINEVFGEEFIQDVNM